MVPKEEELIRFSPPTILWPKKSGPYGIKLELEEIEGRVQCNKLVISGGDHPITATLLRRLPLGRLVDEARREEFRRRLGAVKRPSIRDRKFGKLPPTERKRLKQIDEAFEPGRRGGRKPLDTSDHEEVARIYTEAFKFGDPPTVAVAEQIGVAHSTAAERVRRARAAGLLPRTKQGKASAVSRKRSRRRKK